MSGALRIRPSSDADAEWATAVHNAAQPDAPHDLAFTRWMWSLEDDDWHDRRFACELDDEPLGWATVEHIVWEKNPKRVAEVTAWLHPRLQLASYLDEIYAYLEHEAAELGAVTLATDVLEAEVPVLAALDARGFVTVGRQRYWELDLVQRRDAILAAAGEALALARERGFTITTLAEDAGSELESELHDNHEEARQDVPRTTPYVRISRALFLEWLHDPRKRPDRFWIARRDGELAGMSMLAFPVSGDGVVSTAWTGVARKHRGQGLARALKLRPLVQAIELGVTRVRTDNDSANAPILHLNEELGYREIPGHLKLQLALRPGG